MPLNVPTLDDRSYQQLLDEALARIPVHTPEWTNFNAADPGVTLLEVFAFLTESLLYRANQVPERNRRKFLQLLGLPLQPATPARGLVTFANERGPLRTLTLNDSLEVRAGAVPFRTTRTLDVLPIEAQVYYKQRLSQPADSLREYYRQLYASYLVDAAGADRLDLYETVALDPTGRGAAKQVDVARETVDASLWVALLLRRGEDPAQVDATRRDIAGKTLALGVVPWLREGDDPTAEQGRRLPPGGQGGAADTGGTPLLEYLLPKLPPGGVLPLTPSQRVPQYRPLEARATADVLVQPGVVELTLPGDPAELALWANLDPIEAGVGDFPPPLEDTAAGERLITWLRIRATANAHLRPLWVGINAAPVSQQAQVANEALPNGTGEPDQVVTLAQRSALPGSVRLRVTLADGTTETWPEIDDLLTSGAEVSVPDTRQPPGLMPASVAPPSRVFVLNPEAGEIRFGDGLRGARPPRDALLRADYAFSVGAAGNVGALAINSGPALPTGLKVSNPVRTWGGADAEAVREGERQVTRYLQHRDRLVSVADFEAITQRTPGVEIGRVEVLPAFHPDLAPSAPGDAPGTVTVLVIPRHDPLRPDAPMPDRSFLEAICAYLEPRRLVTTELFLRGPSYKSIWVSVGIGVVPGEAVPAVREAVRQALLSFLSPLPSDAASAADAAALHPRGWPLGKPVVDREILAVASRAAGVMLVYDVVLAEGSGAATAQVSMAGLELPRLAGLSVVVGEPVAIDQLRGQASPVTPGDGPAPGPFVSTLVPVPVIPEECR